VIRLLVALVLLLALTACGRGVRETAPVADAPAQCYAACTPTLTDTGVRWQASAEDPAAWDALGEQVVGELADRLLQCERRRQACAGFLDDLKRRGIYRGAEPPRQRGTGEQP
jgi:hypothetical protein